FVGLGVNEEEGDVEGVGKEGVGGGGGGATREGVSAEVTHSSGGPITINNNFKALLEANNALLEAMGGAVDGLLRQSIEWTRVETLRQEQKSADMTNQMESLEKRLKCMEDAKASLVREKRASERRAARVEEENLTLQEELLRLKAEVGRERSENSALSSQLAHLERQVDEEKEQTRKLEALKVALEGDGEDLQNQVEVLTEERDIARSHEEDLFASLTEKVGDLEALQESYVTLTDR
ncbi:unnamed protein product, partial [Discosporangium mesarthrocarpum]